MDREIANKFDELSCRIDRHEKRIKELEMAPTTLANGITVTPAGGNGSGNVLDGTGRDTYGEAMFSMPAYTPMSGGTTYTSWQNLFNAINNQGDLGGQIFKFDGADINGTSYTFTNASNFYIDGLNTSILDGQATTPQRNSGAFFKSLFSNCHNFTVRGLEIRNMRNSGIELGQGQNAGNGNPGLPGCSNVIIEHIKAHDIGSVALRPTNGSVNTKWRYCEIYNMGIQNASGVYLAGAGEAFYVGFGNNSGHIGTTTEITNNYIHDIYSEAVDFKKNSSGILVNKNLIENVHVSSQGAMVFAINESDVNIDAIVEENIINNVTLRQSHVGHLSGPNDGTGITVASGNIQLRRNIIMNANGHCIDVYANATTAAQCDIEENILYNNGSGALPVRENVGTSFGFTGNNPLTITRNNNIVNSGPAANESLVSAEPLLSAPFNQPSDFAIN